MSTNRDSGGHNPHRPIEGGNPPRSTQFGGPRANPRNAGGKPKHASILKHVYRRLQAADPLEEEPQTGADMVAKRLIEVALEGSKEKETASIRAIVELVDRADGTTKQTIEAAHRHIFEGVELRDRRQTPEEQDRELAAGKKGSQELDHTESEEDSDHADTDSST